MGFTEGVVWSLLGAVAHTVIDVLRKFAAQRLPPAGGCPSGHKGAVNVGLAVASGMGLSGAACCAARRSAHNMLATTAMPDL
jgi:hypothetical protein